MQIDIIQICRHILPSLTAQERKMFENANFPFPLPLSSVFAAVSGRVFSYHMKPCIMEMFYETMHYGKVLKSH